MLEFKYFKYFDNMWGLLLQQVVNMKKPWTKEMLDKLGVKLGALMGTEPWALPGMCFIFI